MPIYAMGASTFAQVIGDWFEGEPLLLFKFDPPQTGTPLAPRGSTPVRRSMERCAGSASAVRWATPTARSRSRVE